MTGPVLTSGKTYPTPRRVAISSALTAVFVFAVDFVFASPTFTGFLFFYTGFILLPVFLFSFKNKPRLRAVGTKLLIYCAMFGISFGFYTYDLALARERAQVVIAAVERYQAQNDRYPDSLADLVPDFLPAVPRPRITPGEFRYMKTPDDIQLMYSGLSPFERYTWSFQHNEWTYLD